MNGANGGLSLPNCWVGFNSSGWWATRVVLSVVYFVYISDRYLSSTILEALENFLASEITAIGEDVRIIEQTQNLVRNLCLC